MRNRVSKRRWKRRCERGDAIPLTAIMDHRLKRWFRFVQLGDPNRYFYYAERIHNEQLQHSTEVTK